MGGYCWDSNGVDVEIQTLLTALAKAGYPLIADGGSRKLTFRALSEAGALEVRRSGEGFEIGYGSTAAAGRGIGSALAGLECRETTPFRLLGIMLDCSRNKVFTVDFLKSYLAKLALMGQNTVMLYTEDTYQLDGEPFFGYMRGGYTLAELQELDAYAATLGIELIGCIQTLGHLEQILQWHCAYAPVADTAGVLLVGEEKTYQLIAKMLDFWSRALRSRRIHIGMDETHDLGRGKFLDRFGYTNAFELFNRHLGRVNELCRAAGYERPTIWSDMYFRLSNPNLDYYDERNPIPAEVVARIPKNVQLCYWDYYHRDEAFYDRHLTRHEAICHEPMMGSGVWTWSKLWYDHEITAATVAPCIAACRKHRTRELLFTMWGDNGGFCQYGSALAGLQYASDLAYGADEAGTAARFAAVTGQDYALTIRAGEMEWVRQVAKDREIPGAAADRIWDDPLLAIHRRGVSVPDPEDPVTRAGRCRELAGELKEAARNDLEFRTQFCALEFLAHKLEFRTALEKAYAEGDRAGLERLHDEIPALVEELNAFDRAFRASWLATAKPFGLEVIQRRNAGQAARWQELKLRLEELLAGTVARIEELDASLGVAPLFYQRNGFSGSRIQ